MCIIDLRIYAESLNGNLSYYRDKIDLEVGCILTFNNGKLGAIEIKLGAGEIPTATENLNKFKENINIDKYEKPSFLMLLTGDEYSYKREDRIYVR